MAVRARDKDRNQVVETLQQAFVDGQIDAEEFERRNTAALSAVHISELERLIRDLQGAKPLAPDLPELAERTVRPASAAAATPVAKGVRTAALVAVSLAVAAVVVVPIVLAGNDDADHTPFSSEVQQEEDKAIEHAATMTVPWSRVKDELSSRAWADGTYSPVKGLGVWRIEADAIKAVFAHWEKAFESPYVRSFSFWPTYLTAERPLGRSRPRIEEWRLENGKRGLELFDEAENGERDLDLFDLHDLDVDTLMDNIERAKTTLNVEDAKVSWIDVGISSSEGVPIVKIWVTNTYEETASMETALDGRIITEWPHTAT